MAACSTLRLLGLAFQRRFGLATTCSSRRASAAQPGLAMSDRPALTRSFKDAQNSPDRELTLYSCVLIFAFGSRVCLPTRLLGIDVSSTSFLLPCAVHLNLPISPRTPTQQPHHTLCAFASCCSITCMLNEMKAFSHGVAPCSASPIFPDTSRSPSKKTVKIK